MPRCFCYEFSRTKSCRNPGKTAGREDSPVFFSMLRPFFDCWARADVVNQNSQRGNSINTLISIFAIFGEWCLCFLNIKTQSTLLLLHLIYFNRIEIIEFYTNDTQIRHPLYCYLHLKLGQHTVVHCVFLL